jgi:hypothetical protein
VIKVAGLAWGTGGRADPFSSRVSVVHRIEAARETE